MEELYNIALGIFGLLLVVAPKKVIKESALKTMSDRGFGLWFLRMIGVGFVFCGVFGFVLELYN